MVPWPIVAVIVDGSKLVGATRQKANPADNLKASCWADTADD